MTISAPNGGSACGYQAEGFAGTRLMSGRLTGFTPSGHLHPGNYIGATEPIVIEQAIADIVVFVSDLHALTLDHEPADATSAGCHLLVRAGEAVLVTDAAEAASCLRSWSAPEGGR
jgi:tRNA synthetases class I (W and Y)